MAALSTQAREELAELLWRGGLNAYASIPSTLSPPCVVLVPDSPYLTVNRVGAKLQYGVRLRLACMAQALDGTAGLALVEQLVDDTLKMLPAGIAVERIEPPTLDTLGAQGSVYVSEITITTQVKEGP